MPPDVAAVVETNDTIVRLALRKIGRVLCSHSFALIQQRRRLFLRCPECGAESEGFAIGDAPKKRPGMERPELLSINAAARKLGRSWEWTFEQVKAGHLPGVQIGRRWFVRNLDAHLDARQATSVVVPDAACVREESSASSGSLIPRHPHFRV